MLGQLADPLEERRVGRHALGKLVAHPVAKLAAPRGEDLLEELVATDRADGREQPGGQRVVRRREEVLGVRRDVVEVARPADAVAHRLVRLTRCAASSARSCWRTPVRLAPSRSAS